MSTPGPGLIKADKDTYRKAWLTMVISAVSAGFCYLPVAGQFLNGFVFSLGGTEEDAAIVMNLTAFVNFFVFLGAYLSFRIGKRSTFIIFGSLRWLPWTLALFVPLLPPAARIPILIVLVLIYGIMMYICQPPWWSMLSECVPPKLRGRFMSIRLRLVAGAVLIGLPFFGWIVDYFGKESKTGYLIIIGIAIPIGLLDALCHFFLPRFKVDEDQKHEPFLGGLKLSLRTVFTSKAILLYCATMFTFNLWMGAVNPYFMSYLLNEKYLHLDMTMVSRFAMAGTLIQFLGYSLFGRACDRIGNKTVLVGAFSVRIVLGLIFFLLSKTAFTFLGFDFDLFTSVILVFVMYIFGSFFWTGVSIASTNIMMALAPKKRNEGVLAVIMFVNLLGMGIAPFIANFVFKLGKIWAEDNSTLLGLPFDAVKMVYLFCYITMLVVIGLSMFIRIPDEKGAGRVFRQLLLPGGFRSLMVVLFDTSRRSVKDKLKTVEKLQKQKHPFGIEHLIRHLEDPSLTVRMQATWALGAIRDSDARKALEAKVRDPHSLIQLDAIRALGKLHNTSSIDVLVESLDNEDRLIRGQAALSLGEFDDALIPEILAGRFISEPDMYVRECIYDALASFDQTGFLPSLIKDLATSDNPLTRRHLAMLAGRYIESGGDVFYQILSSEVEERGSGGNERLERMLRRARRLPETIPDRDALIKDVDRLGRLFWEKDLATVIETINKLFKAYAGILPGLGKERPAIFVLELIAKNPYIAPDNQEITLLAIYAFYRLIEKPKDPKSV